MHFPDPPINSNQQLGPCGFASVEDYTDYNEAVKDIPFFKQLQPKEPAAQLRDDLDCNLTTFGDNPMDLNFIL